MRTLLSFVLLSALACGCAAPTSDDDGSTTQGASDARSSGRLKPGLYDSGYGILFVRTLGDRQYVFVNQLITQCEGFVEDVGGVATVTSANGCRLTLTPSETGLDLDGAVRGSFAARSPTAVHATYSTEEGGGATLRVESSSTTELDMTYDLTYGGQTTRVHARSGLNDGTSNGFGVKLEGTTTTGCVVEMVELRNPSGYRFLIWSDQTGCPRFKYGFGF